MMRSGLVCVAIVSLLIWTTAHQTGAQVAGTRSVRAFLATGKGSQRATTFSADAPRIFVFWKGEGLGVGDTIRAIWIAEDVGSGSKETEIRRADFKVYKPEDEQGAFSLSRPAGRVWPVGKYRVELNVNGAIAEVVKFTIKPGVTIEVQ
jgi:hypothetical protein